MTGSTTPRVMLIGLGLHARRAHYPVLEALARAGRIQLCAVVDRTAAAESVNGYLAGRPAPRPPLTLVPASSPAELAARAVGRLLPAVVSQLGALVRRHGIDTALVATEPLMHNAYASWALSHGLHVLVDKPPTAHAGVVADAQSAWRMVDDLAELAATSARAGKVAGALAQRRYHRGFRYVRHLVEEVRARTGCPPTSVLVEHADGEWRMPWEVLAQDYHPFNQGYGVLLHSGYHAVDTALWLTGVTGPDRAGYDSAEVDAHFTLPDDMREALPEERIRALFGTSGPDPSTPAGTSAAPLGELDARLTVALRRGGATPTVLTISALHSSFSRRGWLRSTGRNLYTGNGRRVHESVTVHQGPFQTIRVHAYKALLDGDAGADGTAPGGRRHWQIQVFRNASLFPGWSAVQDLRLDEVPADSAATAGRAWAWPPGTRPLDPALGGAVGEAKLDLITDFLRATRDTAGARPFLSGLRSHVASLSVVAAAYTAWNSRRDGGRGTVHIDLEKP